MSESGAWCVLEGCPRIDIDDHTRVGPPRKSQESSIARCPIYKRPADRSLRSLISSVMRPGSGGG